ncbi:MAG: M91 family zinc metallopeptidase [Stackebrandtia sp.]
MTEPPINVDRQWFDLKADPDAVDNAATAWTGLGSAGDTASGDLNTAAGAVYDDPWKGDTRDSYETHQKKLRDSCADMVGATDPIATALGNIASSLRSAQGELEDVEGEITGAVACTVTGTQLKFRPKTPEESQQVLDAVDSAKGIRKELDNQLSSEKSNLSSAVDAWSDMSTQWQAIAAGGVYDGFDDLPDEAKAGSTVTLPDGTVVVNTGTETGDDAVSTTTKDDGTVVVTVNGVETEYPPGTDVVLRTGGGNDSVVVPPDADTGATVVSGDGNDSVYAGDFGLPFPMDEDGPGHNVLGGSGNDSVALGGGDNRVSTGGGDDTVVLGNGDNHVATGDGNDTVTPTVFGGDGNDTISSGRGNDTVSASGGNDSVYSGEGDDTVRGGSGNDRIVGGEGDDSIEAGSGDDTVHAGDGRDYVDGQDGDDNISGGSGNDVLYGLNGDDSIHGGSGDEYIEGGEGDDSISGGSGDDILSGGGGDDSVRGGDGADVMYGGKGNDYADGGDGDDKAHMTDGDAVSDETENSDTVEPVDTSFINIDGSPEYQARVRADLEMMAASPTGREMIEALRNLEDPNALPGEHSVTIKETDEGNSAEFGDTGGFGNRDSTVNYNPSGLDGWDERPPPLGLYHELAHIYSSWNGNYDDGTVSGGPDDGVSKGERQATGLPTDGSAYDPNDPQANLDQDWVYTENGMREEWGLDPRTTYS